MWIAQGVLERIRGLGSRTTSLGGVGPDLRQALDEVPRLLQATLGTESGASITEFDGSIEAAVRDTCGAPEADFRRSSETCSLRTREREDERHLAAALRGGRAPDCDGPLPRPLRRHRAAWAHYVPLEKDFSNFDVVVESIRDTAALQEMVERARVDIVDSGRYSLRAFVAEFDEIVGAQVKARGTGGRRALRRARAEQVRRTRTVAGFDPRPLKRGRRDGLPVVRLLARIPR